MKYEVNQKNERIAKLEGDVSKKKDDISYFETKFIEIKIQITKLNVYIEGESFLKRTNHALWDRISQLIPRKWDFC